jgi:hypothetical protein
MMRPSTTHCMEEAGLELDVTHSRLIVSLILAVSGPVMVRVSGATESMQKVFHILHSTIMQLADVPKFLLNIISQKNFIRESRGHTLQ